MCNQFNWLYPGFSKLKQAQNGSFQGESTHKSSVQVMMLIRSLRESLRIINNTLAYSSVFLILTHRVGAGIGGIHPPYNPSVEFKPVVQYAGFA